MYMHERLSFDDFSANVEERGGNKEAISPVDLICSGGTVSSLRQIGAGAISIAQGKYNLHGSRSSIASKPFRRYHPLDLNLTQVRRVNHSRRFHRPGPFGGPCSSKRIKQA